MTPSVHLLSVFADAPHGGNPLPVVIDADGMSDADMQAVARHHGHEAGFVRSTPVDANHDFDFRFWVPNHEMEMCGHATVGAVWMLDRLGRLAKDRVRIATRSGLVEARVDRSSTDRVEGMARVEITQPNGIVEALDDEAVAAVLDVLGITTDDLAPFPVHNARTSRVKTTIPLRDVALLDRLAPHLDRIEAVCERIGSTGLYPYAVVDLDDRVFDARQFPKSSGYPEDAATGIAAAALAFVLLDNGLVAADERVMQIRQGRAMGRPSRITIRFRLDAALRVDGCWLGGDVRLMQEPG